MAKSKISLERKLKAARKIIELGVKAGVYKNSKLTPEDTYQMVKLVFIAREIISGNEGKNRGQEH